MKNILSNKFNLCAMQSLNGKTTTQPRKINTPNLSFKKIILAYKPKHKEPKPTRNRTNWQARAKQQIPKDKIYAERITVKGHMRRKKYVWANIHRFELAVIWITLKLLVV